MKTAFIPIMIALTILLSSGSVQAQVDANRICIHNGAEYYVTGIDHSSINNGCGKYYPSFSHWAALDARDYGKPGWWPWKIRGWSWTGMQANDYGSTWFWATVLQRSVDNPYSTTMTWNYPLNYALGLKSVSGSPGPVHNNVVPSSVQYLASAGLASSIVGKTIIYPSSYGGFDQYLNIFAVAGGTWTLPSTKPYYGVEFAYTVLPSNAFLIESNTSIYEYVWENLGPHGQYTSISDNERDCSMSKGGNKGKGYAIGQIGDTPYFYFWENKGDGVYTAWAMCLFVEDAVTIPVNVPGDLSLANPFVYYGFDVGSATVTPRITDHVWFLQAMTEDYDHSGSIRYLLADSPWYKYVPYGTLAPCVPYGPNGYRLPHQYDVVARYFVSLSDIWQHRPLPGYPACMYGTTTGGHSIAVPVDEDPKMLGMELKFCGFSGNGLAPTASYMVTFF
jgi:hypothetical protein